MSERTLLAGVIDSQDCVSLSKREVRNRLSVLFGQVHIEGWLSRFPDDQVFDRSTYTGDFVDYINSLGPINDEPL